MNKPKDLIIVGTGANAVKISLFIEHYRLFNIIGYAVNESYRSMDEFRGRPLYALEDIPACLRGVDMFVALYWTHLNGDRMHLIDECRRMGYPLENVVIPTAQNLAERTGCNCFIGSGAFIATGSDIGDGCFVNENCYVGMDSRLHNGAFMAAGSVTGGASELGERSFMGFNSTIIDDVHVGKKCIVGAGVTLTRNLEDYSRISMDRESYRIRHYTEQEMDDKLVPWKNMR